MVDWAYISGCADDRYGDPEIETHSGGLDHLGSTLYDDRSTKQRARFKQHFTPNESNSVKIHGYFCPICKAKLTKREGRYGTFYGCSRFPACKGKRSR